MELAEKILAVAGMFRRDLEKKSERSELAPEFNEDGEYAVGQLAIKNGTLMRCITAGTGAAAVFTLSTIEDIVGALRKAVASLSSDLASKASKSELEGMVSLSDIADEFDEYVSYSAGQLVIYEHKLYRCTDAHSGAWLPAKFTESTVDEAIGFVRQKILTIAGNMAAKASLEELAPRFSSDETYYVDKLVIYDNKLYRCIRSHSGDWDADDFTMSTIEQSLAILRRGTPYGLVNKSEDSGSISLDNLSINVVSLDNTQGLTTFVLPERTDGKARDILINLSFGSPGDTETFTLSFTDPDASTVQFDFGADSRENVAIGKNMITMSEVAPVSDDTSHWILSVRHEDW